MPRDSETLKMITQRTYERLNSESVIMPSAYYETFISEAEKIDQGYEKSTKDLLETVKMLKNIESEVFGEEDMTSEVVKTINKELSLLRKQFFSDNTTKAYNTSWLYQHKLYEGGIFKENGSLVSIQMNAFERIEKEYGKIIVEKMIRLLSDYIIDHLNHTHLEYEIVRFRENQFLIFVYKMQKDDLVEYMENLDHKIANYPFKFRHKVLSLSIEYGVMDYTKSESLFTLLDQLEEEIVKKSLTM